ncbi:AsnC family transcriptional regulator [Pseudonocardia tropica]|uniref:AsnC family transcriptional regulator n=1 Tax=Pseudonocardia tropica TaxID=681289 RepID=A0ABV1JSE3_9PSEU
MTGTTGDGRAALDGHDARLLLAPAQDPRATVLALAERVGLSRNTVQARPARLDRLGALDTFERRVDPAAPGYPLTAFVTVRVVQRELAAVADAFRSAPLLHRLAEGGRAAPVVHPGPLASRR